MAAVYHKSTTLAAVQKAGRRLGYQLRPKQQKAVFLSFVSGGDVFVSLTTGRACATAFSLGHSIPLERAPRLG